MIIIYNNSVLSYFSAKTVLDGRRRLRLAFINNILYTRWRVISGMRLIKMGPFFFFYIIYFFLRLCPNTPSHPPGYRRTAGMPYTL